MGRVVAGGALLLIALLALSATATAAPSTKIVKYRGYAMRIPAGWPVYRLTPRSTVCVRFDRHAVYLGAPSTRQRCPANAIGRTEAILVAPLGGPAVGREAARMLPPVSVAGAQPAGGSEAQVKLARHGIEVTATWGRHRALVEHALGLKLSPGGGRGAGTGVGAPMFGTLLAPEARASAVSHVTTGTLFTGLGIDTCSTPSAAAMTAWGASPYRAVGVYIGGVNEACAQPNLTTSWVHQEWAAGWHLIPTYVGLQAPGGCCEPIAGGQAATEGTDAAIDAVTHAEDVGIGPGNPIYFDMEAYNPSPSTSAAVLTFLAAWTNELHAEGYGSGVYSSLDSGVVDLAGKAGTGYTEPDDIWIADWNGVESTSAAGVPAGDWADNQRLHQYSGGVNQTYGGVELNVDQNYLDGATAFTGGPPPPPAFQVTPEANGTIQVTASWPGGSGLKSWRTLGGFNTGTLVALGKKRSSGSSTTIVEHSAFPYYEVEALGSSGQVLATSAAVATRAHLALYGRSAFVPPEGFVGVPSGCFTGSTCRMALTISSGRRVLAQTGRELLATSGGLVYFKLSSTGHAMLAHARSRRLPVVVQASDVSGATASTSMNLVPFRTSGSAPRRSLGPAGGLRIIGLRDFAWLDSFGGILAGCVGSAPCIVRTKITSGRATIATAGPQTIGANEAGYLSFKLNPFGHALLAAAHGNQLGARVTLTDASASTHGSIALSSFS